MADELRPILFPGVRCREASAVLDSLKRAFGAEQSD